MRLMVWVLSTGVVGFMQQSPALGQEAGTILSKAEQLYQNGQFGEAADELEKIAASGVGDPDILYNLGNAYFKANQLGPAMAAYVGALSLEPGDADIRANLRHAQKSIPDKLTAFAESSPLEIVFFWSRWLTARQQLYGGTVLATLVLLLWAISMLYSGRNLRPLRTLLSLAGVMALILFGGLGYRLWSSSEMGAVVSEVAEVYSAPTRQAGQKLFDLREGAPFWIADQSADWLKIRISDGKSGWINEQDIRSYR
jgi:tetratricopeptide (TPR) repeat protein